MNAISVHANLLGLYSRDCIKQKRQYKSMAMIHDNSYRRIVSKKVIYFYSTILQRHTVYFYSSCKTRDIIFGLAKCPEQNFSITAFEFIGFIADGIKIPGPNPLEYLLLAGVQWPPYTAVEELYCLLLTLEEYKGHTISIFGVSIYAAISYAFSDTTLVYH